MTVIVGTRGSKLAITQTKWVISQLKEKHPAVEFEIKVIKTKGDKILDKSLDKIGDKGLFVKEIENELLCGNIDFAVHSMKDMPSEMPAGLKFAGVPKREDNRDVLVLRDGLNSLDDIPKNGVIGTGSKRRKYQLLNLRPDLKIVPIRGNIDSRIRKIVDENLDGIVLAAAGIKRIGLETKISYYFSLEEMLPAPSQGALGIQIRDNDNSIDQLFSEIIDHKANIQVKAERSFLKNVNGSCHIPIGSYCVVNEEEVTLYGLFGKEDGSKIVNSKIDGKIDEVENLGKILADEILKELDNYER